MNDPLKAFDRSNARDRSPRDAWFTTSSGLRFHPWEPDPESISLVDIAHTLARINRWGGHAHFPYSVAQHSVIVARFLPPEKRPWGLLHDATEAYMGGDIVSPIKRNIPALVALEANLARTIERRFGFPDGALEDPDVKKADALALAWEYRDLMPRVDGKIPEPMLSNQPNVPKRLLAPLPYQEAENAFLNLAARLGIREVGAVR